MSKSNCEKGSCLEMIKRMLVKFQGFNKGGTTGKLVGKTILLTWSVHLKSFSRKVDIHVQDTWSVRGRQKGWWFLTVHDDPQATQINRQKKKTIFLILNQWHKHSYKCVGWSSIADMPPTDIRWQVVAIRHKPLPVWQPVNYGLGILDNPRRSSVLIIVFSHLWKPVCSCWKCQWNPSGLGFILIICFQ